MPKINSEKLRALGVGKIARACATHARKINSLGDKPRLSRKDIAAIAHSADLLSQCAQLTNVHTLKFNA
jgi:hypothetical protein